MTILGSTPGRGPGRHIWQISPASGDWVCSTHCSARVSDLDVADYESFTSTFIEEIPSGLDVVWRWKRDILNSDEVEV